VNTYATEFCQWADGHGMTLERAWQTCGRRDWMFGAIQEWHPESFAAAWDAYLHAVDRQRLIFESQSLIPPNWDGAGMLLTFPAYALFIDMPSCDAIRAAAPAMGKHLPDPAPHVPPLLTLVPSEPTP